MKGFFRYVENSTKRRFYRFLLFFILFVIITFCKSCKVYARTKINSNVNVSFETAKCTENSGQIFCFDSSPLTFTGTTQSNSRPNFNYKASQYGLLIKDSIREYSFSDITITSNNQYISYTPFNNMISQSTTWSGVVNLYNNYNFSYRQTINNAYNWFGAFWVGGLVPSYAAYHDKTNDKWVSVDLRMYTYGTPSYPRYDMLVPTGIVIDKVVYKFGKNANYSGIGMSLETQGEMQYSIYPDNNDSLMNYAAYNQSDHNWKYFSYNIYKTTSPTFLAYIPSNSPTFSTSLYITSGESTNDFSELTYNSTTSSSGNVYSLSSIDLEQQQEMQNKIDEINQQIAIQQTTVGTESTNSDFSSISSNYEAFSQSQYASKFTGLVSSIFAYPFVKLNRQAEEDLVRTNINGSSILNNQLCYNLGLGDNPLQDAQPYTIHFFRDYTFNLPCPHTEIYNKLYYGNYGFYSSNFKGASTGSTASISFISIWLVIQHGILVYLLFINVLNIYKYILDSNKADIEVLEL